MKIPPRNEMAAMMRLAIPVVTAQIGIMLMGVVDTIMVGRVSASALAAVALGNLFFQVLITPASGTLMVLDPVVAQAMGAGDSAGVSRGIQRGITIALGLSVVEAILLAPVHQVLSVLHQPEALIPVATSYVLVSIASVVPYLGFIVLRQSLQAIGSPRMVVTVIILANLLNAGLNWVLVYGHLGVAPMGAVGSAWSTLIGRWFMMLALLAVGWKTIRPHVIPWRRETFHVAPMGAMLRLGFPVGMHQGVELAVFAAIGVLMGVLGTREIASHQIALNLASLTFMVPLGVGAATAVRVGHAVGAGDRRKANDAASAGLLLGGGFMVFTGALFIAAPRLLAGAYTIDPDVGALAAALIPIAGVFQVFDGVQAVCGGVLRGLGDTKSAFVVNIAAFWLVGFPVSIALGFHTELRGLGLWWGLVVGLAVAAALLMIRTRKRLRGPMARTTIDSVERAALEA